MGGQRLHCPRHADSEQDSERRQQRLRATNTGRYCSARGVRERMRAPSRRNSLAHSRRCTRALSVAPALAPVPSTATTRNPAFADGAARSRRSCARTAPWGRCRPSCAPPCTSLHAPAHVSQKRCLLQCSRWSRNTHRRVVGNECCPRAAPDSATRPLKRCRTSAAVRNRHVVLPKPLDDCAGCRCRCLATAAAQVFRTRAAAPGHEAARTVGAAAPTTLVCRARHLYR